MKKIIFMLTAVVAVMLSSCSNDDIPVGGSVTITLNPETVVSSFIEYQSGALTSLDSDETLYVDLYIYNEAGNLVLNQTQTYSDYTHKMTAVCNLEDGNYTIVATTHIDSSVSFWTFSGQDNLSTFTVTDNGYIGGSAKILGLTAEKVSVDANTKDINIDVKCAGAVALVRVLNWNRYSNVANFALLGTQSCDYVSLTSDGELNYSRETKSDYSYFMALWDYDSNYSGAVGYTFLFPFQSIKMSFAAILSNGSYVTLGTTCQTNIEVGNTYYFAYDVTSEETTWNRYRVKADMPAINPGTKECSNLLELKYNEKTNSVSFAN